MKKKFKLSRYTIQQKTNDGRTVFYNFQTNALSVYEPQHIPSILSNNVTNIEIDELNIADHKNILYAYFVPNDLDELAYQKLYYRSVQKDKSILNITMLTTLGCNFNCYYCYENKTGGYLKNSMKASLIKYIENSILNKKKLGIAWYGGEPLLYADDIISLSNIFRTLARKHNVSYESKLISNCFLLNDSLQSRLFSSGVRELQVSYDGSKSVHDSIRQHKGKPSFDIITENICRCLEKWKVIIRVNVSKNNLSDIPLLIEQLADKKANKGSIIYFAPIHSNGSICRDASDPLLSDLILNDDFNAKCLEFKELALQLGFKVRIPLASSNFCSAVTNNSMVIEPKGQITKCYLNVGNDSESYGILVDKEINITNTDNLDKWINYNPFSDKFCLDCMVLPLCYGGCPWEAMKMKPKIDRCHPLKNNLQNYIDFILRKIEQGAEYDQDNFTLQLPTN